MRGLMFKNMIPGAASNTTQAGLRGVQPVAAPQQVQTQNIGAGLSYSPLPAGGGQPPARPRPPQLSDLSSQDRGKLLMSSILGPMFGYRNPEGARSIGEVGSKGFYINPLADKWIDDPKLQDLKAYNQDPEGYMARQGGMNMGSSLSYKPSHNQSQPQARPQRPAQYVPARTNPRNQPQAQPQQPQIAAVLEALESRQKSKPKAGEKMGRLFGIGGK